MSMRRLRFVLSQLYDRGQPREEEGHTSFLQEKAWTRDREGRRCVALASSCKRDAAASAARLLAQKHEVGMAFIAFRGERECETMGEELCM